MAKAKSYKLICPIARALDRIGDLAVLWILRDLHAGPARFTDIQNGLPGIAANLLTERLNKLIDDQLIEKLDGAHSVALYGLTEYGRKTRNILFEFAQFGSAFPLPEEPKRPGNLRLIVVPLGTAIDRTVTADDNFLLSLIVDKEAFSIRVKNGSSEMLYQRQPDPDMTIKTSYESLIAVAEGENDLADFSQNHASIEVANAGKEEIIFAALGKALSVLQSS